MAGYIKVILLGNLTRDPDFRGTPSGMTVCEFGVAVNSGRRDDKPYFGQVVTFGKTADACRQYLSKGSQVFVEGKLQNDEWEDRQTGQKRSKTRIVADSVQFIGRNDNTRQNAQSGRNTGNSAPVVDPQYGPPVSSDPADDECPF